VPEIPPDIDLGLVFEDLQIEVRPIPFSEIRARRARRTRRLLRNVTAAAAIVAVVGGIGLSTGRFDSLAGKHTTGPPTPPIPGIYVAGPDIASVVSGAVGFTGPTTLFALVDTCGVSCDGSSGHIANLYHSTDLGAHWSRAGQIHNVDGQETLQIGSDREVWVLDGSETFASGDGGVSWVPAGVPMTGGRNKPIGFADGVAWFDISGHVVRADVNGGVTVAAYPPAMALMTAFLAIDGDHAMLGGVSIRNQPLWLATADRGRTWRVEKSPCGPMLAEWLAQSRDRTLWVTCAVDGGALVKVSRDLGHSWEAYGPPLPASDFYSNNAAVYPVSATEAWLIGINGTINRTTNGTLTVATVVPMSGFGPPAAFAAYDRNVAAFAYGLASGLPTVYVTTDGGAHWTARPIE
jgi:photosystem II stability/assembly factor-like uncharacterized protein